MNMPYVHVDAWCEKIRMIENSKNEKDNGKDRKEKK